MIILKYDLNPRYFLLLLIYIVILQIYKQIAIFNGSCFKILNHFDFFLKYSI